MLSSLIAQCAVIVYCAFSLNLGFIFAKDAWKRNFNEYENKSSLVMRCGCSCIIGSMMTAIFTPLAIVDSYLLEGKCIRYLLSK